MALTGADVAKHVGIVLFSEVEELDAIGPWQVLSTWTRYFPEDGYGVVCLSRSGGLVQCANGLVVQAQHSFDDAPPLDVLIYPGGQGTRSQLHDEGQLNWVRRQRTTVPLMTSVCTGSLVYAAADFSRIVRPLRTGLRWTGWPSWTRPLMCGARNGSSMTVTRSPHQGCPRALIWPCT